MPYYTYISPEGEEKEVFHLMSEINNLSDKTKQEYEIDETWTKKIEFTNLAGFNKLGQSTNGSDSFTKV